MIFLVLCGIIITNFTLVSAQGFYKIVSPRVLRPNSDYNVATSIFLTSTPTTVTVALVGRSNDGKAFTSEDILNIQPYSTRVARLHIGDIEPGDYRLFIRARGGVEFETSSSVKYVRKSYSVFIQTDKAVYNPGHKIMFRAIVLNSNLKSERDVIREPLNIQIVDGAGNVVKKWENVTAPRGVFSNELQLSKNPVLGDWNISVTILKQTYNQTIQVASYILPKFLVNIESPKHITFQENTLTTRVEAMYNYGKKVKGDATITVYPTINSEVIQPIFQVPVRKVVPIEGSATVNFDISNELGLTDEYERKVVIEVIVEEALTGRRQNNSMEVQVHKYDYKMELIKTADYYKPGLKYVAFVKVENHDGSPIEDSKRVVTIRHGYSRVDEVYVEEKHKLDKNGMLKIELYPPYSSSNETALRIEADYLGLKERMPPIPAARSISNNFIQVSLETEKPLINLDIEVLVNCTEPMKYLMYQILGRGDVLKAETVNIDNQKEYRFRFKATSLMVPVCHIIVSYVRDDGELVADTLDIEIEGLLQNYMEIQLNQAETRPDSDIDISFKTQPNSYIGLLAVDENVLKIKDGFDIDNMDVSYDLNAYDVAHPSPYSVIRNNGKQPFIWKQGNSNSHDIFYDSGALLLTNSRVSSFRPTLEDIYLRPVFYNTSTVKPDRGVGLSFKKVTRPPLAGPYAFSRIPRPVWDKPKVYLTEEVFDTWLFSNFSSGFDGKASLRRKVPSSLNTWVISGFSLDPVNGLGISKPKKLNVFKPFAVKMELPHTLQRREVVSIPVVVQNHLNKDLIVDVTIHNPEQKFYLTEPDNSPNSTKNIETFKRKKVTVKAKSNTALSFLVIPILLGDIEIKVSASGSNYQDSIIKNLKVKAEGETLHFTKTVLLDLRNKSSYKGNITFDIPKNAVKGSEVIEISAVGDLLGPTIINLENLIYLPTGCAEQNLIHFMPNLIILNYLRNTRQLSPTLENQAIIRMETSYQEQLRYKKDDGSFNVFGKNDELSNVWITAYTAYSFLLAKPYIFIDDKIIHNAYKWLAEKQAANGSFVETGPVIHQELESRNGNSLALTAYVVMTFLEFEKMNSSSYQNIINKGLDYIARNIDESEEVYTLAICAYVLELAKHPSKQGLFNLLESEAKNKDGLKWWAKDFPLSEKKNPWHALPKSIDIEATAYGLLTLIEANLLDDTIPVISWLVDQQNKLGGFASSQDTAIALHAIYKLILKLSSESNMRIVFSTRRQETNTISINRNNAMIVQKVQVGKDVRQVNISAEGSGLAIFRVSFQYNMNVTGPWPMFILDPQVDKNSNQHHLQLSICTQFVAKNLTYETESNMAIMEVNLPSGFTADIDALPSLEVSQNVQKVETRNSDSTVLLYFNNITRMEYCPTVSAFQTQKVANMKPAYVSLYDYYDSSRHARIFYKSRFTSVCNICEEEDCSEVCKNEIQQQIEAQKKEEGNSASRFCTWTALPALLSLIAIYL